MLKVGVKYNYDKWTAYINGQYVSSRNTEKQIGGKLYAEDGFFTADAGVSYQFMKNGTISFAVNNILIEIIGSGIKLMVEVGMLV